MPGINKAELGIQNDLPNRIGDIERDLQELKTHPQRIGNGSIGWAVFGTSGPGFSFGPISVPAGTIANFTINFMPFGQPFIYNNLPAINRVTGAFPFVTLYVDNHTSGYASPYGGSLTTAQGKVVLYPPYLDFASSGLSETNGQFLMVVRVENKDTAAHNVYVDGNALIPRPALAPQ